MVCLQGTIPWLKANPWETFSNLSFLLLKELWEMVRDREAWLAAAYGVPKSHDLATEQQLFLLRPLLLHMYISLLSLSIFNVQSWFSLLYLQFFVVKYSNKHKSWSTSRMNTVCHINSTINHLLYLFYFLLSMDAHIYSEMFKT